MKSLLVLFVLKIAVRIRWTFRDRNWVIVFLFLQFVNAMINSDLVPNQPYMAYVTFIGEIGICQIKN